MGWCLRNKDISDSKPKPNNKKLPQLVFLINSPHLEIWKDCPGWYDPGLTHAADIKVTALQPCKANQTCT